MRLELILAQTASQLLAMANVASTTKTFNLPQLIKHTTSFSILRTGENSIAIAFVITQVTFEDLRVVIDVLSLELK